MELYLIYKGLSNIYNTIVYPKDKLSYNDYLKMVDPFMISISEIETDLGLKTSCLTKQKGGSDEEIEQLEKDKKDDEFKRVADDILKTVLKIIIISIFICGFPMFPFIAIIYLTYKNLYSLYLKMIHPM